MKIRPTLDRIIVKRDEADKQSPGGIMLPDNAKEKPRLGTVVAVGPGDWNQAGTARMATDVSVGQRVLFTNYAGSEFEHEGQKLLALSAADIIAVMS